MSKDKSKNKTKAKAPKAPKAAKVTEAVEAEPSLDELKAREAELKAALKAKVTTPTHPHLVHLERVKVLAATATDKSLSKTERKAAKAELESLAEAGKAKAEADVIGAPSDAELDESAKAPDLSEATDAELKARVDAKRILRKLGLNLDEPDIALIDRNSEQDVDAYNLIVGTATGSYLTSTAERDMRDAQLAEPKRKAGKGELVVEIDGETLAAPLVEVVEVATETGREFASGPVAVEADVAVADEFAGVDETPKVEFDGLGRYKIYSPATGKYKGYTRVTTFIDNLEDKTALDKWKLRTLLEGVAINEERVGKGGEGDRYVSDVAAALHSRDVAAKKLAKRDRKGELAKGERGKLEAELKSAFSAKLNAIATEALDLGGVHERANKGTDLHALCEVADDPAQGWPRLKVMHDAGEITSTDLDDVRAYSNAMAAAGLKVVEVEQVVVDDEACTSGRLDRVVLVKLPGMARAIRVVADIKTGRVDFGQGKIGQQLAKYAGSKGYDPATPKERRDLKLSKAKGLLIHLPQGEATCTIHVVDLVLGDRGNKLSQAVRTWRNEGKKAIDFTVDLAALAPEVTA